MKQYILLSIFLVSSLVTNGQSAKRAYKSLEKYEYEKAKEAFQKLLSEDTENVAASFGMALIIADDKSPYFNIIDSWEYIEKVKGNENKLTQDDMEILADYFMNTEQRRTSRPVKKKIEIAIEAIESRLIKYIREENDLEACYEVLERYPDFHYYDNVVHIRNQFEFRKYEKLNTFEGYTEFIEKFPDAAQVEKARRYRDAMAFNEVKSINTVEAYNGYIEMYPKSRYVQHAAKLRNAIAFSNAQKANTLESYKEFVKSYPEALEIPEARKFLRELMYEKAKQIKSIEAYNEFIRMYPNGGYYLDVFNLKSEDLGMQAFKEMQFEASDLVWSRVLDNNEQLEEAKALTPTKDGGILVAALTRQSDTSFSDAWIIKLDSKGKMVWNKQVGQPFDDDILEIIENSVGDIFVVGYTKTSSDSLAPQMGWMFKLSSIGNKVWNKNLGEMKISSVSLGLDDKLYLSTYLSDTMPENYFIQIFNSMGSKVSQRDFVRHGKFNDMHYSEEQGVFLLGSEWFAYTDPKLYIRWEDTLSIPCNNLYTDQINDELTIVSGDSLNHYLTAYNVLNGNSIWQKTIPKVDSLDVVNDLIMSGLGDVVVLGANSLNSYALKYNGSGEKVGEKLLPQSFMFNKAVRKQTGGVFYLIDDGKDIIVLNLNSVGY